MIERGELKTISGCVSNVINNKLSFPYFKFAKFKFCFAYETKVIIKLVHIIKLSIMIIIINYFKVGRWSLLLLFGAFEKR